MSARRRSPGPVLPLGTLAIALSLAAGHSLAPPPVTARLMQFCVPCPPPTCEPDPCVLDCPELALPWMPVPHAPPGPVAPVAPPAPPAAPAGPASPSVTLRVQVPASVAPGQDLQYQLTVANPTGGAAHHVLVRNPLPANATFVRATPEPAARDPELLWRLGTLEAGTTREITLVLRPTGQGDVNNCARVQYEHGLCVSTKVAHAGLSVRKTGPTQAVVGETLNYRIVVTNTGSADATGVMLLDTLPAGLQHSTGRSRLTWEVGTLLPGQSSVLDYQLTAKAPGRQPNKVVATTSAGLRDESEAVVTVADARMSLKMTGPAERPLMLPATYQITVTNAGTAALTDVLVQNPLPAQTTFVSASSGGQLVNNVVQWQIGTLDPGASRTFEVELRARAVGRVRNEAFATAARGVSERAEFTTEFSGQAGLLFEVIDSDDPVEVNGTTRYLITVRNQGMVPATRVQVAATVPAEMAVLRVTGPADHTVAGQHVLYEPLTLPAGGEARYEISVKALKPGDVRFRAELTADQLPAGPVHEEESTLIYADLPTSRRKPPR
jgi:uncharacterized repeat protein (TIGR01451 family)